MLSPFTSPMPAPPVEIPELLEKPWPVHAGRDEGPRGPPRYSNARPSRTPRPDQPGCMTTKSSNRS